MSLNLLMLVSLSNLASKLHFRRLQRGTRAAVRSVASFQLSMMGPISRRGLLAAAVLALFMAQNAQALTIDPTFDSSITNDPNHVAIENVINGAIAIYQHDFSDPITVNIDFQEMTTGLSENIPSTDTITYSSFISALHTDAKTANDTTAISLLPITALNPVTGTPNIELMTANEKALGITPSTFTFDGTILLNTHVTDVGSPGTSGAFSLMAWTEHEIDEVLGLQSSVAFSTTTPIAWDLFRYDASGNRSFTKTSTAKAYFSINGTTDLAQFDNQNDGGDFGDWQSNPLPNGVLPKVQDAFATVGAHPALGVELTALDVIGYDFLTPVPEQASIALFGCALTALGVLRPRSGKPLVSRA